MRRPRKSVAVEGVLVACVSSLLSAAVVAAHGGDESMLHGCQGQGTLRLIAAEEACDQGETAYDWKIQGAAGPQGEAGAQGASGAPGERGLDGPPGPAGPSYRFRVATEMTPRRTQGDLVHVRCESGEQAVAGGIAAGSPARVTESRPTDGNAWQITAQIVAGPPAILTGFAICMKEVSR